MTVETRPRALRLLDPTGYVRPAPAALARRLQSLDGKVVGFLDNGKWNVDALFARLEEHLRQRYRLGGVIKRRKPNISKPAPAEIIRELAEGCDLVITAIGD